MAHIVALVTATLFAQTIMDGGYSRLWVYFASYLAAVLIDIDHLPIVIKRGFKGLLDTYGLVRYPLHNLLFYGMSLFVSAVAYSLSSPVPGVIFASLFLHMSWDLFEDTVILKSRGWLKLWL